MNSTRMGAENFGASMEQTIARVQATRAATTRKSQLYLATILTAGIIAVGVMLTFAAV